jgi:hypothetical protein
MNMQAVTATIQFVIKSIMKYIQVSFIFICCVFNSAFSQTNAHEQVAGSIAQKMTDSLGLTTTQKNQIYNINMQLANQKALARQQYSSIDSVRYRLQKIENSRDSLYHTVLSEDKYFLYKEKKRFLVATNH